MVLFIGKTKNQSKVPFCTSNNTKDLHARNMIPQFSIKSFVPVKANNSSFDWSSLNVDKNFTMATLKRPKVGNTFHLFFYFI